MTTKTRARSPLLEAVHDTAKGLNRHGFIDKRRMGQYVPRFGSCASPSRSASPFWPACLTPASPQFASGNKARRSRAVLP